MALFRALETKRPASERVFSDPLARAFLSRPVRAVVAAAGLPGIGSLVPALIDRRWPGPRLSAVVRTRVLDDAVRGALAEGLDQLVLLGAGYDSRPYRLRGARNVRVFEVDLPATQAVKRRVITELLGTAPAHVRFVPVDFEREPLAQAMAAAGLAADKRTFFLWEGVVAYLSAEAVDATLRWAGGVSGSGSELAFTYVHRGLLDGSTRFAHADRWVAAVREADEPFVFGLDPRTLHDYLAERRWRLLEDRSTTEALAEYGLPLTRVPSFYRLARARVEATG
jgi:methyltransferase (TIGR00027 family)